MVRIAQVGVGYWGPNLLRNLSSNYDSTVKAVVDPSKERQEFVKKTYPGIYVTDELDSVINDPDIDAVVIATPVASHYDLTIQALNKGKHVLVEKPMATKTDQVREISQLARKKELVAMVGHTFLFNSAVRYVKSIIESGELGDIRYIYPAPAIDETPRPGEVPLDYVQRMASEKAAVGLTRMPLPGAVQVQIRRWCWGSVFWASLPMMPMPWRCWRS